MEEKNNLRLGLDIGSTTAKLVMVDANDEIIYSKYERHNANVHQIVSCFLEEMEAKFGDITFSLAVTGSVGMGLAEANGLPFVQEVVAATELIKKKYPTISTIIDIGGEDAKIVYLGEQGAVDLRMNGNCAGGTGAFIDQMAIILGVEIEELNLLALQANTIYPIASRCGVFSKTDVQNLISKNVSKSDIAASIFHAVSVQTVVTLSHGCQITPKILFCGGPLTFIPALRKAFINYLNLEENDFITPENANIIPAWGTALCNDPEQLISIRELRRKLACPVTVGVAKHTNHLETIFSSEDEYKEWKKEKEQNKISQGSLQEYKGDVFLGIDSGSTTTKIVLTDPLGQILFTHYISNSGDPISTVRSGLVKLKEACQENNAEINIAGSCSTGYGEDLIKCAFNLENGIIETIAHYMAAQKINPKVSFILDIGGQDMKALFVEKGALSRMEINEACSSGCGSFIETFAKSLNYNLEDFNYAACTSKAPSDLGTRCTVFMNSKVKQVLREGATIGDIAAGLSYSVVKNCLYKVLRLRDYSSLGKEIVVQGGTMRNDAVVRAFEKLIGFKVYRSNMPELMGAYGCALYARNVSKPMTSISLSHLLETASFQTKRLHCKGCENTCVVNKYIFSNSNIYYSGNKCEKVFTNSGEAHKKGRNAYIDKYNYLFDRKNKEGDKKITIGIPRCLGMYEDYPFWHTLFNEAGIKVCLSSPSTFKNYEAGVHTVMSDNICFPAKLVHSHIYELLDKKVDRIFFPYTVFEKMGMKNQSNSYNCPIVTGYSDVIKSVVNTTVPIDSPTITFKDKKLLKKTCLEYLRQLEVDKGRARKAFEIALLEMRQYEEELLMLNYSSYEKSRKDGELTLLLAGRPYHTDPLIQHKLSEMIADMGVNVITEDIIRKEDKIDFRDTYHVTQWAYINRILAAAKWVAQQGDHIHFVQMTSFGCGPDAFLLDEVKEILNRHGKSLTLLKIDDVNNIGSLKLRVRSVIESLRFNREEKRKVIPFITTKKYLKVDRKRKIIAPFFTDYISPLLPPIFNLAGYEIINLPKSDDQTVEAGLKYANNEVCYPATLVVGDILKTLKEYQSDKEDIAVAITQTGGQCRASNYLALIKKAMVEAGFEDVPLISISLGSGLGNDQPGFKVNWLKILPVTLITLLYSDCISKFYHAGVVREKTKGEAKRLREYYLEAVKPFIESNSISSILEILSQAAEDFKNAIELDDTLPRVGIVGEIFLKFHSYANRDIVNWLIDRKIEVMPPILTNFFLQSFVNNKINVQMNQEKSLLPSFVLNTLYSMVYKQVRKVNQIASVFPYYTPFEDIFKEASHAEGIVSLSAQFGEGWLLPAEIVSFAKQGVNNVISLQPFGCIANHIVSKGVEKKIKTQYPEMNLLSLDFDGGVSEVNIVNRLLLFINNLK